MISTNIYSYVTSEESKFETEKIRLGDNWEWSLREHVQMIFHLKHGQFYTGENDFTRAFKAIMSPILELSYWTEDIELKEITFFIESEMGKELSFLVKKYHDEIYVKENDIDKLLDGITEDDIDYGGVIVQDGLDMPEVMPLNSIAFCDQTDILAGPIGFKHFFSPSKLRAMVKAGWGSEKNGATITIEDLCILADNQKENAGNEGKKNDVSGKVIEVYIVRGDLPESYLKDNNEIDNYIYQTQVVAFYKDKDGKKQGVTLYRKQDNPDNMLFFTSKEVYQRGLGKGVGETLVGPQIWTNFLNIHKTNMLEAASKVPLYTDDLSYTQKNKIQDMENLEVTTIEEGKQIRQVPTAAPANIQLFSNEISSWYEHAQVAGSAYDSIMGKEESSGMTFRGQERLVAQGNGPHKRRKGKRAKFVEEIYRKMIIPRIKKKILKGKKFLASLSSDEMNWLADRISVIESNRKIMNMILVQGKQVTKQEQDRLIELYRTDFLKKGNNHLIEILRDEFEDVEIKMGINVGNKQKDLANLSDKLLSIFQFVFANPAGFQQAMQIPALAKSFENILEFGGMSIANFSSLIQPTNQQATPTQQPAQTAGELLPAQQATE